MGTLWTKRTASSSYRDPRRLPTEETGSVSGNGKPPGNFGSWIPTSRVYNERGLALAREIDEPGNAYMVAHVGRELSRGVVRLLLADEGMEVTGQDLESVSSNERNRPPIAKALGLEPDDPRVDEWFFLVGLFSRNLKWRPSGPKSDTVREAFERFTSLLYGRSSAVLRHGGRVGCASQRSRLQLVNMRINSVTFRSAASHTGTGAPPLPAPLRSRRRPGHGQRNYFFQRLRNPGWVKYLAAEGFFTSPPGRQQNADGSWSPRPWPLGNYLVLGCS